MRLVGTPRNKRRAAHLTGYRALHTVRPPCAHDDVHLISLEVPASLPTYATPSGPGALFPDTESSFGYVDTANEIFLHRAGKS